MITSAQITNTEIFTFVAVLDFKLLMRKVLFINRKDDRNCKKIAVFILRRFFRLRQLNRLSNLIDSINI